MLKAVRKEKNVTFVEERKILFWNYVKTIPESKVYGYLANIIKKNKESYEGGILPKIKGMTIFEYLSKKERYNLRVAKTSDFPERVEVAIDNFKIQTNESIYKTKNNEDISVYTSKVMFDLKIESENIHALGVNTSFIVKETYIPTKRLFKALFQNSFNGILMNARDIQEEFDAMKEVGIISKDATCWVCEECKVQFKTIVELFNHIIEEHHFGSVLTAHPYDPECIKIKRMFDADLEAVQ